MEKVRSANNFEFAREEVLDSVVRAGSLALEVRRQGLSAKVKSTKEDLVTEGDKRVSEFLQESFSTFFPGIVFLDEETDSSHGLSVADESLVAVIDPIDGTGNYYKGYLEQDESKRNPNWGVSVGILREGEAIAGVIYQPQGDRLFYSEKGRGAYLNGDNLAVSNTQVLTRDSLIYSVPYKHDKVEFEATKRAIDRIKYELGLVPDILGSQVIEIMEVAKGAKDVFMMFKTKPWDVAAAISIVTEAGGSVFNTRGEEYQLFGEDIFFTNGQVDFAPLVEIASEER